MVKLYPNAPVYALAMVYMPAVQERLRFLTALTGLHNLQMEAVALIYMQTNCIYMPEPSTGDHYTLLPLARDKNICIGALSSFVAAKLTVSSTHSSSGMGVHLKLEGVFASVQQIYKRFSKFAYADVWGNVCSLRVRGLSRGTH